MMFHWMLHADDICGLERSANYWRDPFMMKTMLDRTMQQTAVNSSAIRGLMANYASSAFGGAGGSAIVLGAGIPALVTLAREPWPYPGAIFTP